MKSGVMILIILLSFFFSKAEGQSAEVQQLLLNVEKLAQLKQMLADLKKGYQILFTGYTVIKNTSEGNFNLHQAFMNKLLEVSPIVRKYKKITDIITIQITLVKEYKAAFKHCRESNQFTPDEISYLGKVYGNLFEESLKNLDALASVITSKKLRMSDDERLTAIDHIYDEVQDKLLFLRQFNSKNKMLALQRAKESADINSIRKLHGVSN